MQNMDILRLERLKNYEACRFVRGTHEQNNA